MKVKKISISLVLIFSISLFSIPNMNSFEMQEKNQITPSTVNPAKHLTLSLSESVSITTNDQKNNANPSPSNSKNIDLVDNVKIEINNLDQGTIAILRPSSTQVTTIDKISNNERLRFNGKTYVVKNSNIETTAFSSQITNTNEFSNNAKIEFESLLEKIIVPNSNIDTQQFLFDELESTATKFTSLIIYLDNPSSPVFLIILIPTSGYILFRFEGNQIQFFKTKKFFSFCFIFILILSTFVTPFSVSSNYFGGAFAEVSNDTISNTNSSNISNSTNTFNSTHTSSSPNDAMTIIDNVMANLNSILPINPGVASNSTNTFNSTHTSSSPNDAMTIIDTAQAHLNSTQPFNSTSISDTLDISDSISNSLNFIPNATKSFNFSSLNKTGVTQNSNNTLQLKGQGYLSQQVNSTNILQQFTISTWVKPDYTQGSPEFTIVSKENSFKLAINNNITPRQIVTFSIFDGIKWQTVQSQSTIPQTWTQVVATYNSSSIAIYVNGTKESTVLVSGTPSFTINGLLINKTIDKLSSTGDITIGASLNTNRQVVSSQFSGLIRDVNLYNSSLSSIQVRNLYRDQLVLNTVQNNSIAFTDSVFTNDTIEVTNATTNNEIMNYTLPIVAPELKSIKSNFAQTESPIFEFQIYNDSGLLQNEKIHLSKLEAKINTAEEKINSQNVTGANQTQMQQITKQIAKIQERIAKNLKHKYNVDFNLQEQIQSAEQIAQNSTGIQVNETQYGMWQDSNQTITIQTIDSSGNLTTIRPTITKTIDGKFEISLDKQREFKPGLYTIKTILQKDGKSYTLENNFAWGLVSLNTKKSIYKPGETADFVIVVLDNQGHPVSNSTITMKITDPNLQSTILSTGNEITANSIVGLYDTRYTTNAEGNYTVNILATNPSGVANFTTFFIAAKSYPFDIIRTADSKIDPVNNPNSFKVRINITSFIQNKNLQIQEFIPSSFKVTTDANVKKIGDTKILTWTKEMIGNKTFVDYTYSVPLVFPQLYTLGPLQLHYGNGLNFTEARPWFVANDPVAPKKVTGALINEVSTSVTSYTTTGTLPASSGNYLYVVGVAVPANIVPTITDNLTSHLTWTQQKSQCGAKAADRVTVWTAFGAPTSHFTITIGTGATSDIKNIIATAFTDVPSSTSIESVHGANTAGLDSATCSGGTNNNAMHQISLSSTNARSNFIVFAGTTSRTTTQPANYTQIAVTSGTTAKLYMSNSTLASTGTNDYWPAALSGTSDWATVGFVIMPTVSVPLSDSVSISDSLTKSTIKSLSDSVSISDSPTKSPTKLLTDSVTISDSISKSLIHNLSLSDSVSISDSLTKSLTKSLMDSVTITNSIAKSPTKSLSDSVSISSSILESLIHNLSLSDPLSISDSLTKSTIKSLSDSVSMSDSIAKSPTKSLSDSIFITDSMGKSTSKFLTDSVSISDSIIKTQTKSLTDSLSISDSIAKSTSKSITDSISMSDSIAKSSTKSLSDGISISDAISISLVHNQSLNDSLTIADSIAKSSTKSLSDSASLTDSIAKSTTKSLSDFVTINDTITESTSRVQSLVDSMSISDSTSSSLVHNLSLLDSISLLDSVSKSSIKSLTDSASLFDSLSKSSDKSLSDSISMSDSVFNSKVFSKSLNDSISMVDSTTKSPTKSLTDAVSIYDLITKKPTKSLSDSVSISDTLSKTQTKSLSDSITTSDSVTSSIFLAKSLSDAISISDSLSKSSTKSLSDSVLVSDSISKSSIKSLTDSASISDSTTSSKVFSKSLSDSVSLIDIITKTSYKSLSDAISLTETISNSDQFAKSLSDSVSISESTSKTITKSLSDNVSLLSSSTGLANLKSTQQLVENSQKTVNVSPTTPELVITSNNASLSKISVPSNADATLNYSKITQMSGTTTIASITNGITITKDTTGDSQNNVVITIPDGISISGTSWNGILHLPTIQSSENLNIPVSSGTIATPSIVINIGSSTPLTFNQPVRVLLTGQAGTLAGFFYNPSTVTEITSTCTSDSISGIPSGANECKINVGSDLAIWTNHFTSFTTWTTSPAPVSTPNTGTGGGGGGGFSSGIGSGSSESNGAGEGPYLKIQEITYDMCGTQSIRITVGTSANIDPYVIVRTSLTGVINAKLAQDQPYTQENLNSTIKKLVYEIPVSSKEKSFEVLALESIGHNIFSVSKTVNVNGCQGDISYMTQISDIVIPNWVKKVGGYWSQGEISDGEFINAIQYLINKGIMTIPSTQSVPETSNIIPTWVKENAGYWANGTISNNEFVQGIQYLISHGIIQIS